MTPLQTLDLILCMAFAYFYVIVGLATVVWIVYHIFDFFSKENENWQQLASLLHSYSDFSREGSSACLVSRWLPQTKDSHAIAKVTRLGTKTL